jgi:hypothetical protein
MRGRGLDVTERDSGWEQVGAIEPGRLMEGRSELHHAAQLVAAVGASLLDPRSDDSHPNLGWQADGRAFIGHTVPAAPAFAAALRPADLMLQLQDETGAARAELGLVGRSIEDALAWLREETRRLGVAASAGPIALPAYDLPPHPVAKGGRFGDAQAPARAELARWFAGGHRLLAARVVRDPTASSVRIWPHHFDIATLITLERDASGGAARTVGIGFSPGDETYPEPYWYVSPWPYPAEATLPSLGSAGHWHVAGYTAAVLLGRDIVAAGDGVAQSERVGEFVAAALAASRHLLAP